MSHTEFRAGTEQRQAGQVKDHGEMGPLNSQINLLDKQNKAGKTTRNSTWDKTRQQSINADNRGQDTDSN